MRRLGLAVRWSDVPGGVGRITRLGGVPVRGRPHHLLIAHLGIQHTFWLSSYSPAPESTIRTRI